MFIEVARLPREGGRFEGEEPASALDLRDPNVRADSPLRYDLTAGVAGRELVVRGRVSARVRFRCSRCAEFFAGEVVEPAFLHASEVSDRGATVDLTAEIRESILLRFPDHPVCSADCRGLCPVCGANRNRQRCGCAPGGGGRWTALEGLRLEK
jgi:uncharacterized protein